MGISLSDHAAPPGRNHCPVHPSEPLVGMCGCGTLFCRRCSPSTVFCARCNAQHEHLIHGYQTATISQQIYHPTVSRAHAHAAPHPGHISQRLVLEALFMTVAVVAVIAVILGMQGQTFSFGSDNPGLISYGIDAGKDPVQRQTTDFSAGVSLPGAEATITSEYSYSISARVESKKRYDDAISGLVPFDLLLSWGKMAESDVDSKLDWNQSDRQGMVSGSLGGSGADVTADYVISHVSNNHVIPANDSIRKGIDSIHSGDLVRIEGRLVDVRMKTGESRVLSVSTSTKRTDQGDGACEIIYVESLRVNGQTY